MATLLATRAVQYVLEAEFVFDMSQADQMANTSGVVTPFSAASGTVYDIINLMGNVMVVGGDISVEVASNDSGVATIAIGDSNNTTRYLAATSIKTAGRTALVPTGYRGVGENIRMTLANAGGNATQGKVSIRVLYGVLGRANEVVPN